MGKKQKIILPPDLPPEVADEEIEVSEEDLQFVNENVDYAGFVSKLDTHLITKHVTRVADVQEDALEALYEKRSKKKSLEKKQEDNELEVDRVDALPIKTLDGKLHYRTAPKTAKKPETIGSDQTDGDSNDEGVEASLVKLTKPEKRAKLKKGRKEAKKQEKDAIKTEVQPTPQAQVLAEVEKELTAEESNKARKFRLAELGTELLTDPESNIKSLKEMLQICKEGDHSITVIGLKSLLAVFKDIIPGYRIRLPTAKEQEMVVSKAIKKMRLYESTLLSAYKAYLNKLIAVEKQQPLQRVAIRCLCTLLDAHPHFNYWESLLAAVLKNLNSTDDVVRKLCCATVKSLFTNEGKHGGEATVHAVRYIAEDVKACDCELHPDSIEVFLSLSFDEDIRRAKISDDKRTKNKKDKRRKGIEEPSQVPANERKKNRKEQMLKMTEEVKADLKAASLSQDVEEKRQIQSQTLSAVFETYFRILTHTMQSIASRNVDTSNASTSQWGTFPLLAPCLDGIGKFAHHIDLDFMGDLITYLRKLSEGVSSSDNSGSMQSTKCLSIAERLRCCIVAFKVMRNNLDALNVDLQDFFVQLYSILLEYRAGRDQGEVLVEALKIMLCDDRQHDMQRAAAFIKRLSTFSLCFDSAEAMAALVTVKHLLQKNVKCRNLLENDAGGGSVSGPVAMYRPQVSDPNLSGALSSVLWELNLLRKHYNPLVSTLASTISTMSTATPNQVLHSHVTPQQAFIQSSIEQENFDLKEDVCKNRKRKRGSDAVVSDVVEDVKMGEEEKDHGMLRKKFCDHFVMVHDMSESKRLKDELSRTRLALELYEKYKNDTKMKRSGSKVAKKSKQLKKTKKITKKMKSK